MLELAPARGVVPRPTGLRKARSCLGGQNVLMVLYRQGWDMVGPLGIEPSPFE